MRVRVVRPVGQVAIRQACLLPDPLQRGGEGFHALHVIKHNST
jgi:hypothetical protein